MVELGIAQGGRSKGASPVQQWGVWFPPYRTYMSAAQGCAHTSQHGRVFDLLGIAHVGVTAQGCAFTSQHGRVCDLFRVAHVGVTAQGCASEREIKSFHSFSAQGPESSHMSELSHPCAIKIKVRNHLQIDRTGVR